MSHIFCVNGKFSLHIRYIVRYSTQRVKSYSLDYLRLKSPRIRYTATRAKIGLTTCIDYLKSLPNGCIAKLARNPHKVMTREAK